MGDMSQIRESGRGVPAADDSKVVRGVCPCCGHEQAWRTPDPHGRDGAQCLVCLGWIRPAGEWDEGPGGEEQ